MDGMSGYTGSYNPEFVLTQEYLHEAIDYNPETGDFVWKVRPEHHFKRSNQHKSWNNRYSGTVAGKVDNNGYLNIKVNYQLHRAHRLAWFYIKGFWPDFLDHKDGDKLNNRFDNFRNTTRTINNQNACKRKDNSSGVTGVHWDKSKNSWTAAISVNGSRITLMTTKDLFEACCARKSAERYYGFSMRHGSSKK